MSELCLLSKHKLCNLLLYDMFFISSLILSHPLYFSYFIFFSPYILKLFFFLSPLFLTTALLLIGFFTLAPANTHGTPPPEPSSTQPGFLKATYIAILNRLRSNIDVGESDLNHVLELEAYRLVFHMPEVVGREHSDEVMEPRSDEYYSQDSGSSVVQSSSYECSCEGLPQVLFANSEEKTLEIVWEEITSKPAIEEEEKSEGHLKEFEESGIIIACSEVEGEGKGESLVITGPESIDGKREEREDEVTGDDEIREHTPKAETSNDIVSNINNIDNDGEYTKERSSSRAPGSSSGSPKVSRSKRESEASILRSYSSRTLDSSVGSYGSMRRDRKWSRTLACKLFEDRHNVEGDEGMDLLWETYEKEQTPRNKNTGRGNTKKKKKNKSEDVQFYNAIGDDGVEEDGMSSGHLCCLQALKFSGGKVNLGMKKPSLVKISKAIKGIGWLHHITRHHEKRVHL